MFHTISQCQNKTAKKSKSKMYPGETVRLFEYVFFENTKSAKSTFRAVRNIFQIVQFGQNNHFDCCLDYYFIGEEKAWLCLMRRQVGNTSWHCQPRKTHKHHTPGKFSPWKGKTRNLSTNCFPHLSLQVFASNHWQRRTS